MSKILSGKDGTNVDSMENLKGVENFIREIWYKYRLHGECRGCQNFYQGEMAQDSMENVESVKN